MPCSSIVDGEITRTIGIESVCVRKPHSDSGWSCRYPSQQTNDRGLNSLRAFVLAPGTKGRNTQLPASSLVGTHHYCRGWGLIHSCGRGQPGNLIGSGQTAEDAGRECCQPLRSPRLPGTRRRRRKPHSADRDQRSRRLWGHRRLGRLQLRARPAGCPSTAGVRHTSLPRIPRRAPASRGC